MRVLILTITYWLTLGISVATAQWQLQIESSETELALLQPYFSKEGFPSQAEAHQAAKGVIADLQQAGYFQAHLEPLPLTDSLVYRAKIHPEKPFRWAYLQPGNLDPLMQAHSGYRDELFLQQPFRYADFQKLVENCLEYSENNGYPFASIRLRNVEIKHQEVSATLDYQSGPLIRFGELNIQGTDKINPEFLEAYLGIRTGTVYSEKKIAQLTSRLQKLPFLSLSGPIETQFQNEVADIFLSLAYQASSQVDGILSVLPAEGQSRGLLLTGELNVLLRNLGRSGKVFALNWQRLQIASQQLSLRYSHPNVLRSPLGVEINFNLLKEDTLFLNQRANLALSYLVGGNHRIEVFGDWRSSRLIGENTAITNNLVPSLANTAVRGGGVGYSYSQVDEQLFPRRGHLLAVKGRLGQKTTSFWMTEPIQVGQLTQQSQASLQWAGELSFTQYYMLGTSLGIYNRLQAAGLADAQLFTNELYRLGGLRNLRGFVDNAFFVSQYALNNLELRWLLEPESAVPSYLFAFYDQAWLKQQGQEHDTTDIPLGIGAGVSISTRAGLFSLVYALGKSQNQTLHFSASKVHFGYISRF
ncbi:BamA/TamA family outer membrane protein [Tunicatimonas pelagia]|uniref:BamA/TamA family outer membrane protein n=1 Tax=Tunicatimonas pelagia TaxID=931531 RepID=UPI0026665390|nr:BamA/TamA family outer membrane protein [Tunicatimonas pelagia]WKN41814.1 BamA/TamA family outer membrane protein [Tunicatimonas pelagia]